MGTLVLEIGQCGIQIGLQAWEYLSSMQYYENNFLFRSDHDIAHSILIDTESKVVKPIFDNRKKYSYFDTKNIIYQQSGRGNNWTIGYFDSKKVMLREYERIHHKFHSVPTKKSHSPSEFNIPDIPLANDKYLKENTILLESIGERIRKEIEKMDFYLSTLMIYSLGGGTGSGLGSRILEEISDNYGGNEIFNAAVFPTSNGESPLQHYNCLFSLSKLQEFSNGVMYFCNDSILNLLTYVFGKKITDNVINVTNINEYIASCLASVLKINDSKGFNRMYGDIISEIIPNPNLKFFEVFASPYCCNRKMSSGPESTWEVVVNNCLRQMNNDEIEDYDNAKKSAIQKYANHTIALYSLFKSGDIDVTLQKNSSTRQIIERKIKKLADPVPWNPEALNYEYMKEKYEKIMDKKSLLVFANRTGFSEFVREINNIGYKKYKAKAFLHWYYKYGLIEDDFQDCFNCIDGIIESYSEANYF